jgi:hypothetical protein
LLATGLSASGQLYPETTTFKLLLQYIPVVSLDFNGAVFHCTAGTTATLQFCCEDLDLIEL